MNKQLGAEAYAEIRSKEIEAEEVQKLQDLRDRLARVRSFLRMYAEDPDISMSEEYNDQAILEGELIEELKRFEADVPEEVRNYINGKSLSELKEHLQSLREKRDRMETGMYELEIDGETLGEVENYIDIVESAIRYIEEGK